MASYLEREQFEAVVADNGVDAIAVARDLDPPDVVILDIGLPGIDGLEVCRQLRTFSDAYVVMLTARDTEIDTVLGLTVGAETTSPNPSAHANSSRAFAPCCVGPPRPAISHRNRRH